MASIFARIFKIGQSEAHSIVDKLEDPIKLTEQGIRDLKTDLQNSLTSLAEVKAIALRQQKEAEDNKKLAVDYERKAMLLLQRMQKGELDNATAERLATEALTRKEECEKNALRLTREWEQQDKMAGQLQANINKLKSTVNSYENELVTLKARAKTATATKKINQQLSKLDSSGTIALLEKMKNKVTEDETLAAAYGEIASSEKSVDEEIKAALAGQETAKASEKLAELKTKMGIQS